MARQVYANLMYPYNTDFIWMIHNNHIKKCDVMIRDIDIAQDIWGKDINTLKIKTAWTKPNPAEGGMLKIPK